MTLPEPSPSRPLGGLRVIDISTYVAGPSGGMTLAQLGADVIRVDPLGGAPDMRRLAHNARGRSLYWASLNRAKRSIEVDLASDDGRDLVRRLLAAPGDENGILLTNAVGAKWLAYDALSAVRPDLIEVFIAGNRDGSPAVDYTVNAEVGLPWITGPAGIEAPVNHVLPAWDFLAGQHAARAILAAERLRARTGKGQSVTIYLSEVALTTVAHMGFIADAAVNRRPRLRDGNFVYGMFGTDFGTADGRRVMIVALTERHWKSLVELSGVEAPVAALEAALGVSFGDEITRWKYRGVLYDLIRPWFESRTLDEVSGTLKSARVLWAPYRTFEELVDEPDSLLNRSPLFADLDHPGIGTFPAPRSVLDFAGADDSSRQPAPAVGQHTDDVLRELLGLDAATIDDLRARGVVGPSTGGAGREG